MQKQAKKDEPNWEEKLTSAQYHILRKKGTELPFSGKYYKETADGMYACVGCGNELFSSDTKYDAGCGWPSFWAPVESGSDKARKNSVEFHEDKSHGMTRVEVICAKCDGHLGHVFDDGPADKTGKRFCINSGALQFNTQGD